MISLGLKRRFIALWKRELKQNICVIKGIWTDRYPEGNPKVHTLLEKIVLTPILLARMLSLSNLVSFFSPSGEKAYLFIDLYIISWALILFMTLFYGRPAGYLPVVLASYRIIDIIHYQLCILLIDSQREDWKLASLRRNFISSILNLIEIIVAFAIIYLSIGNIIENRIDGSRISTPLSALYYSIVTMATLGYGEFIPSDDISRSIVIFELFTEVIYILTIVPVFVSNVTNQLGSREYRDPEKKI